MALGPTFGRNAVVKLSTIGSSTCAYTPDTELVDLSRQLMSITGLPGERELADVTCCGGAVSKEWLQGLNAADVSMTFLLDQTSEDCVSAWKTLCNASTDDTDSRYFFFAPAGTGNSGEPIIHGRLWIGGITLKAAPLEPMTFTVSAALGTTILVTKV